LAEIVRAVHEATVPYRDAHPDVIGPRKVRREFGRPLMTLCEHLIDVVISRDITSSSRAMSSAGLRSWNRSLIELTKITRGFFHLSGYSRRLGHSRRSQPCS